MRSLVDTFACNVMERGFWSLWMGPLAFVIGVPCALALKRRGKLYWTMCTVMLAALAYVGIGLLMPMLFIGALAIPVLMLGAFATVIAPLFILYWLIASRRPQHVLEALLVLCASATVVTAGALVIAANAAV